MPERVKSIMSRIRQLQDELEEDFEARRAHFQYDLEDYRVRFHREIRAAHRKLRTTVGSYVKDARLLVVLTAPVIYAVIIPLVLLDLFASVYQRICFPVYGVPRVRRRDYIALDRHHLQYLNAIEKVNCAYCGYANGLLAYVAEIASRTEQYWCPIKHARRVEGTHKRYPLFFDYGDGVAYKKQLDEMRNAVRKDPDGNP